MATLAEIRAKLREQEDRKGGGSQNSGGDNAIYPHWNMAEGSEAVLRFFLMQIQMQLSFGKSV